MPNATLTDARKRQGKIGQFLTPEPVADFMASLFGPLPETVRLLDAGAGAGALTASFVSQIGKQQSAVRAIDATLYECDPFIQDALSSTMQDCVQTCESAGIQFTFSIHEADFIQEMSTLLAEHLFALSSPTFDAAITNPPYRKIGIDSAERRALRTVGIETSNLYTGFVALIQRLLAPTGQIVGITPRSFCNGPYFRQFREDFLGNLELHRLHVFESRNAAFRNDRVLQENIIFHAVKGRDQPRNLVISSSSGEHGGVVTESMLAFDEVVHPHDAEKFIHIPSAPSHAAAKESIGCLRESLSSLGISVSTGRVVDFRLKNSLRQEAQKGTVPLVYPCHFNAGKVCWPKAQSRKPNAILDNNDTRPWLVPSGVYLLTKRFTSKEERRRLVACLFDPDSVEAEWLGFENHLNYFHTNGRGLERDLAVGLFAFLNSTVVDQYFRRFSGHTQVNASDLRKLPYPDRDILLAIGRNMTALDLSQTEIDEYISKHLHACK